MIERFINPLLLFTGMGIVSMGINNIFTIFPTSGINIFVLLDLFICLEKIDF